MLSAAEKPRSEWLMVSYRVVCKRKHPHGNY